MSKTVLINDNIHNDIKKHCKKNNMKINEYINNILKEHIDFKLKNKSKLPLILKDSTGEVVETIICSQMSSEYIKNLPKEITLIRSTKDNTGFIANYIQK